MASAWQTLTAAISASVQAAHTHLASSFSSSSQRKPPDPTFTLFPQLPLELQRQIWTYAVESLAPRVLEIHQHKTQPTNCPTPTPALLQTCQQSRLVALSTYRLAFFSLKSNNERVGGFYINYSKDIVYFGANSLIEYFLNSYSSFQIQAKTFDHSILNVTECQKLQPVAVSATLIHHRPGNVWCLDACLHTGLFSSLTELVILGRQIGQKVVVPGKTPTLWVSEVVELEWQYGMEMGIGNFKPGFWSKVSRFKRMVDWWEGALESGKKVDLRVGSFVKGKGDRTIMRQTWGGYMSGHLPDWAV